MGVQVATYFMSFENSLDKQQLLLIFQPVKKNSTEGPSLVQGLALGAKWFLGERFRGPSIVTPASLNPLNEWLANFFYQVSFLKEERCDKSSPRIDEVYLA